MVTTGFGGAVMCSVAVAVLLLARLPYWSVCVAVTVTALVSPGLGIFKVTMPVALLYVPVTPLAAPVTVPLDATFSVVLVPLSTTVTVALPEAARLAAFRATV